MCFMAIFPSFPTKCLCFSELLKNLLLSGAQCLIFKSCDKVHPAFSQTQFPGVANKLMLTFNMEEEEPGHVWVLSFCRKMQTHQMLPDTCLEALSVVNMIFNAKVHTSSGRPAKCARYLLNEAPSVICHFFCRRIRPEGVRLFIAVGLLPVSEERQ